MASTTTATVKRTKALARACFESRSLLDSRVADLRARMGVDAATPALGLADALLFGLSLVAGLIVGLLGFAFMLLFLPLGLATFAWRRAKARREANVG